MKIFMRLLALMAVVIMVLVCSLIFVSCAGVEKVPEESDESHYFYATRRYYDAAKDVFIGRLLKVELVGDTLSNPISSTIYRCTAEVGTVLKGDLRPGDMTSGKTGAGALSKEIAVEYDPENIDWYDGMLKIGDRYMFMHGQDPDFSYYGKEYDEYCLSLDPNYTPTPADKIRPPEYFHLIHLLDDGTIETGLEGLKGGHYEFGIKPPKTYDELMDQLRTPLPTLPVPTDADAAPIYACPCEFPDEMIRQGLNALSDPYRSPAGIRERFYCEKHGVDNLKRFENEEQSAD